MKRLTKNDEHGGYYSDYYGPEKQPEIQKLGQVEDIEDDFGIGISVIHKALTEGVWVRLYGEMAIHIDKSISLRGIDRPGEVYHFSLMYEASCNTYQELPLREYGRIWAITREELE